MKEMAVNLRNRARKVKARWTEELCRKSLSGITVIELVLILVINLIPYFGVDIVCIE